MTLAEAYLVLGVDPRCSERDLTRQFHRLAQQTHPDVGGSEVQFRQLANAFAVVANARAGRGSSGDVITTHITSLGGRVRLLRREVHRRMHDLTRGRRHTHSNGGQQ